MKRMTTGVFSILVVALLVGVMWAQRQGGSQGRPGGGPGRGGPGGQQSQYQPSMNLLIMALNANGDNEISAAEIGQAAVSLKKLDRNRDGKLTIDEVMPAGFPPFGGPGQGGFAGPQQGGFEQGGRVGGPGHGGPGHGGPGQGGPDGQGGPGGPGGMLVEQLMGFDTDKDGKIAKDELSVGVQGVFEEADTDKDGAISQEEAEKLVEKFGPPHGGPGGQMGGAGRGRPAGDQRPQRPE